MRKIIKNGSKIKNSGSVLLIIGLIATSLTAFSQSSLPPHPTPPPPNVLFNKINPFKKNHKDSSDKRDTSKQIIRPTHPGHPAGPPPNPLNWFHKKKTDTVKSIPPSEKA